MKKERINEIWGILFLLLGLFTLTSLLNFHPNDLSFYSSDPSTPPQNITGIIGAYTAFGLHVAFGVSALLIPALFLLWAACFFTQRVPERKFFKFLGLAIALFATSTIVAISTSTQSRFEDGGALGYVTALHLLNYFGVAGSYILAGSCLMLSLLLATDFLLYPLFKSMIAHMQGLAEFAGAVAAWFQEAVEFIQEKVFHKQVAPRAPKAVKAPKTILPPFIKREKEEPVKVSTLPDVPLKVKQYRPDLPETPEKPAKQEKIAEEKPEKSQLPKAPRLRPEEVAAGAVAPKDKGDKQEVKHDGVIGSKAVAEGEFTFPPIDILKRPVKSNAPTDNLQENSKILEDTLAEFGIEVKVIEVEQGPVITRYELLPAPGVKVNSIAAVSDDIALALKATSVRLIIPIPGKSAVGVEVPNNVASAVYFRELIESNAFKGSKKMLPLALGKDTSGKTLIADLATMPHLLIAGTTGSGKTVCVNSIIAGLLYACSPQDLKFVMVDPKMVELAVYNKIPHMLAPVVTDAKKAAQTLNWVLSEMENRYKLLATVGVRNIQSFNSRPISEEAKEQMDGVQSENVMPARLPYIVVIIDELADLMMVAQDKVETAITRLAQLSRAVGIHLILATQRPSVDVITGVIKANFPARISFKVASKIDSRTVLDCNGADKLIGRGDMLFMQPGDAKPFRGQAALIVDEEINAVVKFVSDQAKPEYHPEIANVQSGGGGKGGDNPLEKDELYDEAVAVVLETGQASTSNLQRRLRLGYTRAARIIDQMEANGVVGPSQGAKPRDIYGAREEAPLKTV